jgi:hypothetical protein
VIPLDLNKSTYHFTAQDHEDAPPMARACEVYNLSVTATHVGSGATYTGAGCNVPLETSMLYLRNPMDTNNLWTEVDLLGELFLNITVEVSACTGMHNIFMSLIVLLAGSVYSSNIYPGAIRRYN